MENNRKEVDNDIKINILGYEIFGIKILWTFCILAFVVWVIYQLILISISKPTDPGRYGDMFGSLNALFAALAFVGLIYAIFLQHKELSLQREELRLAREELTQQTRVISAQLEAMQQSLEFERAKVLRELEPIISGGNGGYSRNQKIIPLRNSGGPISEIVCRVESPNNTIAGSLDRTYLVHDSGCELILRGYDHNNRPEVIVELSYKNSIGTNGLKRFRVPEDTDCGFIPLSTND